jgi:hypothetical protein
VLQDKIKTAAIDVLKHAALSLEELNLKSLDQPHFPGRSKIKT